MAYLKTVGLRKAYDGTDVVSGLDLELDQGMCFGLLGPNGAGKTTTLRLCLGLTEPDAGEITVLGYPVPQRAREARARIRDAVTTKMTRGEIARARLRALEWAPTPER